MTTRFLKVGDVIFDRESLLILAEQQRRAAQTVWDAQPEWRQIFLQSAIALAHVAGMLDRIEEAE